jgi:hypothetical protein
VSSTGFTERATWKKPQERSDGFAAMAFFRKRADQLTSHYRQLTYSLIVLDAQLAQNNLRECSDSRDVILFFEEKNISTRDARSDRSIRSKSPLDHPAMRIEFARSIARESNPIQIEAKRLALS